MCGIVALYGKQSETYLHEMMDRLHHRGPDEGRFCNIGELYLGHKRLSIIGPESGTQPIPNESGDLHVIANGQIYNYRELKKRLKNHTFSTESDSEVIVHLYEEMGKDCLKELDGMFAFVLSDKGKPFAARDTLGIKPLYYARDEKGFYFASEMKSLIGFTDNIQEFPPGHYYTPESGIQAYSILEASSLNIDLLDDLQQAIKTIKEKLEQSVEKRIFSDVPLGIISNGRLNSSIISALVQKHINKKVLNSFCAGMKGANNLKAAREISSYLGTAHHEYEYTMQEIMDNIPQIIYYLESFDPSLVRSAIPTYFVARLASKHVKVLMSGIGADELFSGYNYLKEIKSGKEFHNEHLGSINALHLINLQRLDRMTMAHSIEGRVPFLDLNLIRYVLSLPANIKLHNNQKVDKWILRKAFEELLPEHVMWQVNLHNTTGTNQDYLIREMVEKQIPDREFNRERFMISPPIRNKEELYYYRIFRKFFNSDKIINQVGRWATA